MSRHLSYKPQYGASHALVVGINCYPHANPLSFAVNDAGAIARTLVDQFGFPPANVTFLEDGAATKGGILKAFLKFADGSIGPDDRIVFFFAGHGHTIGGRRETGFLVPQDGTVDDLSSLIRWDEFTRNADLVPAKHMLFLMDACYGGLAVHRRAAPAGSMRFLSDLLQRYSRQVLAAGKPDQAVSDGGGTRTGHSIFTSHVLDAMEGNAALANGLITGNSLMSYVYEKVGADPYSQQTPHYGSFDGDGDFVFNPEIVAPAADGKRDAGEGDDVLVDVAALPDAEASEALTLGQRIKDLIPVQADKIKLDDIVNTTLRMTITELGIKNFPVQPGQGTAGEAFPVRVNRYDEVAKDLQTIVVMLAHWGESAHRQLLAKVLARLAEADRPNGGLVVWLHLMAYPVLAVIYAAGIAALAADRYDMLHTTLLTPVRWARLQRREPRPIILPIVSEVTAIFNNFKSMPGAGEKYIPRNEHQLSALQPVIEDQLFLGRSYEELFDQFEIMLALVHADISPGLVSPFWGPPGRFAYKERSFLNGEKPFTAFANSVRAQGKAWPGFAAGFFNGSLERFEEVAQGYEALIAKIGPVF